MDIVRAFTFSFEDRAWVEKLLITLVISAVTALLTPLIVGLLGWAALLGYQVELIQNWRSGTTPLLPAWRDFTKLLNTGFYPLVAFLVYQIPNAVISGTILIINQSTGGNVISGTITFFFVCCMFPILLVYNILALPMFALGMGRFVDDRRINAFFEIGYLIVTLRDHLSVSILYLMFVVVAYLVFTILSVPTIGIVPLALAIPVLGALNGQLTTEILGKPKRVEPEVPPKPKRR